MIQNHILYQRSASQRRSYIDISIGKEYLHQIAGLISEGRQIADAIRSFDPASASGDPDAVAGKEIRPSG